jgi:hypothetical protein
MVKIPKVNNIFIPPAWASEAQFLKKIVCGKTYFIFTNVNLPWQKSQTQTF